MSQLVQQRPRVGIMQVGIILTALVTAGAHLFLASHPDEDLRVWFFLNGLGYLALLVAFFLPQLAKFHNTIRWAFIGYTLLTIVLWFFLGSPKDGWPWDPFDTTIKVVEVALVTLLFFEGRRTVTRRL